MRRVAYVRWRGGPDRVRLAWETWSQGKKGNRTVCMLLCSTEVREGLSVTMRVLLLLWHMNTTSSNASMANGRKGMIGSLVVHTACSSFIIPHLHEAQR